MDPAIPRLTARVKRTEGRNRDNHRRNCSWQLQSQDHHHRTGRPLNNYNHSSIAPAWKTADSAGPCEDNTAGGQEGRRKHAQQK
eukprot:scaffold37375_cov264-Isochrysis_galbana.AAC.1